MKLYQVRGCPFAHRARIVLDEKKLAYEVVYFERNARPAELEALSNDARSPTLFDGDDRVWESTVVTEFLEEKYPQAPRLMPADPAARARVRLSMKETESKVAPTLGPIVQETVHKSAGAPRDQARIDEARDRFRASLAAWTQRLEQNDFIAGADFSLADVTLFTLVASAVRIVGPTALPDVPALRAWYERVDARPASRYE